MSTHFSGPSRRDFLQKIGGGFGSIALASMLEQDAQSASNPLSAKRPPLPAKARAVIQIFCPGGLSHVDSWDYKPELAKRSGKPFDPDGKMQFFASKPGNCQGSYWPFRQHGEFAKAASAQSLARAVHAKFLHFAIHSILG